MILEAKASQRPNGGVLVCFVLFEMSADYSKVTKKYRWSKTKGDGANDDKTDDWKD